MESNAPTINLNGTAVESLMGQYTDIIEAITALLFLMAAARPHGRDYQLAPETYAGAVSEWRNREIAIKTVYNEIYEIALDVSNQ